MFYRTLLHCAFKDTCDTRFASLSIMTVWTISQYAASNTGCNRTSRSGGSRSPTMAVSVFVWLLLLANSPPVVVACIVLQCLALYQMCATLHWTLLSSPRINSDSRVWPAAAAFDQHSLLVSTCSISLPNVSLCDSSPFAVQAVALHIFCAQTTSVIATIVTLVVYLAYSVCCYHSKRECHPCIVRLLTHSICVWYIFCHALRF